jgi:cystathionine beta-synthase
VKVANNICEAVGNTPLVRLSKLPRQWGIEAQILVKIGYMNPGGSYKDRIGMQLIQDAEDAGHLKPGGTVIECTSGNTGMGLALAAMAKGYRCVFVMPDKMSREKIDALRALGSEVIVTPTAVEKDDPRSYYSVAARLNAEIPNSWHSNQYDNQSNPRAHYNTTAPEIWRDTEGKITAFVNGMGTGGCLTGVGRFLKEKNPDIKIVGVDPVGSMYFDKFHSDQDIRPETYLVEGIGEDFYPSTMDLTVLDDVLRIDDKKCFTVARKLARLEGIFSGGSTGAAVWGALEYAKRNNLGPEDVVVTMACDHGLRYLSKVFNEQWLRENSLLASEYELEAQQLLSGKSASATLLSVEPSTMASAALQLLKEHDVSQIPVISPGNDQIGSISEAQLVELFVGHKDPGTVPVEEIMGAPFPVVPGDTSLEDVAARLTRENPAVLVRKDNGTLGIITKYDLISHIAR